MTAVRLLLGALAAVALVAILVSDPAAEVPVDPRSLYDPIVAGEPFDGGIRWVVARDGIRPIYEPTYVAGDESGLADSDVVLGLEINGEARAYPIGLLAAREIVNDVIDGTPVIVSWCPLCGTGTVHRRVIDSEPVLFGNQGALWNNAMTWWDHRTGSIWSQPLGIAIAGPLTGQRLDLVPSTLTTWGPWRNAHPDGVVLEGPIHLAGPHDLEVAVVVLVNGDAAAYPLPLIRSSGPIRDSVGGVDLTIDVDQHGLWSVVSELEGAIPTLTAFVDDFRVFWPHGRIYGD